MRIRYFEATDTLFIEFRDAPVADTRDLDENTHASQRADIPQFSFEKIAV